MKKIITTLLLIVIACGVYSQNGNLGVKKLTASDSVKGKTLTVTGKYTLPNSDSLTNYLVRTNGLGKWNYVSPSGVGQDSIYVSYCCGCSMITGYKNIGDTLVVDTCYVNKIILDSLFNHLVLINKLDTGKVSTSGDNMYGDLIVNSDLYADTTHSALKQSIYINKLASWDSQGVLNDSIIPYNISDTLYNKIVAIRPNKPDTSFINIDLIANTTLFPKGTYFHIYKGSYTATVNLARDSCVLYFDKGAIITKGTPDAIFDYSNSSTYKNEVNILGYGDFYKISTVGEVLTVGTNSNTLIVNFSTNTSNSTTDKTIYVGYAGTINIKGNIIQSSGLVAIYIRYATQNITVNVNYIYSTANNAISYGDFYNGIDSPLLIKATKISSTSGSGVVINGTYNGTIECSYSYGSTYGVNISDYQSIVLYKGNANSYLQGGTHSTIVGNINYLYSVGSRCTFSGYLNKFKIDSAGSKVVINGNIALTGSDVSEVLLGEVTIYGTIQNGSNNYIHVNGGTLINYARIKSINTSYSPSMIKVTSGTFINKGTIDISACTYKSHFPIQKIGGTVILDNCGFIRNNSYQQYINCPNSNQNIKIYSGGVTANGTVGDLLSAKKCKDSVKVNAIATTTFTLSNGTVGTVTRSAGGSGYAVGDTLILGGLAGRNNCYVRVATITGSAVNTVTLVQGGTGYLVQSAYTTTNKYGSGSGCTINVTSITNEVFTETDVVTYNTTALLAQRIVALINASPTINISATYISGDSFNIEAKTAGEQYVKVSSVNLTPTILRLNSYAITDLTGGAIIEEPDVTF